MSLLSRFFAGFFGGFGAIVAAFVCIYAFEKLNEKGPSDRVPTTELHSPDFIELNIIERVQHKNGLRYSVQIKNNGTHTVSKLKYGISFYLDGFLVNSCNEGRYDDLAPGASHIDETHCIDIDIGVLPKLEQKLFVGTVEILTNT
ncbi:MAG: hypothetical protein R3183_01675 [Oleiphilaceae bacterium]|nr:hypothetical protein [Oleiphilaceae bacterium]